VAKKVRRIESWKLLVITATIFFYEWKINNNKKMQEEGLTIFHYGYEFRQPICIMATLSVFFVFLKTSEDNS